MIIGNDKMARKADSQLAIISITGIRYLERPHGLKMLYIMSSQFGGNMTEPAVGSSLSLGVLPILQNLVPSATPEQAKIHLATSNQIDDPLDVYLAGNFNAWQQWQKNRNFERPYVLSLIAMPGRDRWLFAGLYESAGRTWYEHDQHWDYDLRLVPASEVLQGRMIVRFTRSGRQPYVYADNHVGELEVFEILPEPYSIAEFPGYRSVNLSRADLELICRQQPESWRTALSNVAGVYLISDTQSGKLYVGSATSDGGIWQRWCDYAVTGHGGNRDIKQLLAGEGIERTRYFHYSILEIADTHTSPHDVRDRESHWKDVLMTRTNGLNAN